LIKPGRILGQDFAFNFEPPIEVSVKRLDKTDLNDNELSLKIDVPGAEYDAISGDDELMPNVSVIEFAGSIIQLYEGKSIHYSIARLLIDFGFTPRQIVVTHWNEDLATVSLDSIYATRKAS
jgi:hypothetical protein